MSPLMKTKLLNPQKDFLNQLKTIMPTSAFSQCLKSFQQEKMISFRANTLKISGNALTDQLQNEGLLITPIPWQQDAFCIPSNQYKHLYEHQYHQEGYLYIQNISSQLVVSILDPQPGDRVLDIAAAPGGKSLQMASLMKNHGKIDAIEIVKSRFFALKSNSYHHNAKIINTYLKDGGKIWKYNKGYFDRILVDAPCTLDSPFRFNDPDSYKHLSMEKINDMQSKQRRLLFSGIQCLKPGGTLVYSTCSFSPEENELVINRILEKFSDEIFIDEINLPIANYMAGLTTWQNLTMNHSIEKSVRIIPSNLLEACFICKIKKIKL